MGEYTVTDCIEKYYQGARFIIHSNKMAVIHSVLSSCFILVVYIQDIHSKPREREMALMGMLQHSVI